MGTGALLHTFHLQVECIQFLSVLTCLHHVSLWIYYGDGKFNMVGLDAFILQLHHCFTRVHWIQELL